MIHSFRQAVRLPAVWLALVVATVCIGLQLMDLSDVLRFNRQAIATGQWWSLFTGNFVHLGSGHLWMNMAGFALVVWLVWIRFQWWEWLLLIVVASLAVGFGLYWRDPDVSWYVGFSGTLHGLIIAGCLADLRYYPRSTGLLLLGVVAKLGWEQYAGALPGSESMAGGRVVVNSHLYGAIAGALVGALLLSVRRGRTTHTSAT